MEEDELPEWKRPQPKIDLSKLNTQDPEGMLKMTKQGRTLMMFASVSGIVTLEFKFTCDADNWRKPHYTNFDNLLALLKRWQLTFIYLFCSHFPVKFGLVNWNSFLANHMCCSDDQKCMKLLILALSSSLVMRFLSIFE